MRKLLVVEAEGEQRQSRIELLERDGFEVITAETAADGLRAARQQHPDLILCGLDLSDAHGGANNAQLLRGLNQEGELEAIPVVLLTHSGDRAYWRQCADLGADDCLIWPFAEAELMAAINARLRKQDALTQQYNTLMRHTAERLNRLAHYDSLTDLPNHHLLSQRLNYALQRAHEGSQRVALLSVSLDRLRQINNTLGYPAGDTLLRAAARRLIGTLPPTTSVARLTGNQFAIVLPDPPDQRTICSFAEDIIDSLSRAFSLPGQEVFVTTSIGIAVFPDDTHDLSTLLRQADAAMDWAKQQKSNYYQFYRSDMPVVSGDELQLETWLRYAIDRQEFQVYYQPKQTLRNGQIEGAEALIRWKHPEYGSISPGRFIPIAEDTGLIVPIGEWVLRTVCRQMARWQQRGLLPVQVSINLSSVQLNQTDLCQLIEHTLQQSGLPPSQLELEVTETALMQDIETALALLHDLKRLGVRLAIDDFGTGYASLGYLRQLPIDTLKIDHCFVRGLDEDPKNQVILHRIIAMAHDLGLKVVAEGVETAAEVSLLKSYACDAVQGFLVGPPVAAPEFAQQL